MRQLPPFLHAIDIQPVLPPAHHARTRAELPALGGPFLNGGIPLRPVPVFVVVRPVLAERDDVHAVFTPARRGGSAHQGGSAQILPFGPLAPVPEFMGEAPRESDAEHIEAVLAPGYRRRGAGEGFAGEDFPVDPLAAVPVGVRHFVAGVDGEDVQAVGAP